MDNQLEARIKYGEIGEGRFERFCNTNSIWFQRFGISTKDGYKMGKELFYKIPKIVKGTPDYWMITDKFYFVEVKMADRPTGEHVKIKEKDIKNYATWSNVGSLLFFVHNQRYGESFLVEYYYISELIKSNDYKQGMFPENGKYFWEVKLDDIRRVGKSI